MPAIYPMPYYDAPHALEALLTNPLLLAHEAALLAEIKEAKAGYNQKQQIAMGSHLLSRRDRINNQYPVEPRDKEGEQALFMLLESPYVKAERPGLRNKVHTARPSEYPWLRGLIEEAITTRADAAMLALVAA